MVELSWYGDGAVAAPLGGAFHSRRLRLISSQVGQVAPVATAALELSRGGSQALALLADPRLDALITDEVAFADRAGEHRRAFSRPARRASRTVIRY